MHYRCHTMIEKIEKNVVPKGTVKSEQLVEKENEEKTIVDSCFLRDYLFPKRWGIDEKTNTRRLDATKPFCNEPLPNHPCEKCEYLKRG